MEEFMATDGRNKIFEQIKKDLHKITKYPKMIGITGVDNAGKTEFASALHQFLNASSVKTALINLDDFHNPKKIRYQLSNPVESYTKHAFNLNLLANELLAPLKRDGQLDYKNTLLDLDTDDFTKEKHFKVTPNSVVILEGVLLFRPPIDQYIDYRIFIDIDFEQMVPRAVKRDGGDIEEVTKVYKNKRIPIQEQFFREFRPKDQSDIVVNNNDFLNPMIDGGT